MKDNGAVLAAGPQNVISVVLGGLEAKDSFAPMPAIGAAMSDQDVADVTNYVRQAWTHSAPATATQAMVLTLRGQVDGLLNAASRSGCPPIADPKLAKALADAGVVKQLQGIDEADMYGQTGRLVLQLKGAVAGTLPADVINGLTAAYCPIVRGDAALDENAKALMLGRFANYVYLAVADRSATVQRKKR